MRKTFKYRARLNRTTGSNCDVWLALCRDLYNIALEQRITAYKYERKSLSANEQKVQLPELKSAFPEFKQVNSQTLQDVVERVDRAFAGFFRRVRTKNGKAGFPRFKGKNRYHSFTLKQSGWRLEGRDLYVRNLGRFRLFLSRPIEGDIKTITIHRDATGNWYACFSCDNVPERRLPPCDKEAGLDVGIHTFCADSEGNHVDNPTYFRESERLLRRRQRALSRKKKGSSRRYKSRILVARAHEKVRRQRLDFLHKTANHYVQRYGTVYIEDLQVANMIRNRHLSKSIGDAGWGTFYSLLSYKAEEAGRKVVKVNPKGTSQDCSGCGAKVPKDLSVRVHLCPFCNLVIDRDHNAALNILRLGQSLQAQTSSLEDVA